MGDEVTPEVTEVETTTIEETPASATTTESTVSHRLHPDDISAISDNVFGRIQRFAQDLVQAGQQAEEIAANMLPPTEAPPEGSPAPEEAPPPDQGPQRRHGVFAQPFKRREN